MALDPDTCYRALRARDGRFDGVFYVAVTTTGIYCRPTCPARTPARDRCEFFSRPAEAERRGYRACFRCRPELAPGLASIDSVPRLVRAAVARIDAGYLNEHSLDELAAALGVTARHLRRAVESELGVPPVALAQTRRLALAKLLLHDTRLSLTDVAFAAGFASVRRFNALFQQRFGRPPSALRREHGAGAAAAPYITLRLGYRAPLAFGALLAFLRARAIPGVETIADGEYARSATLGDRTGWLAVRDDPARHVIEARVALALAPKLMEVAARLRALLDLDARPDLIAGHLLNDAALAPLVAAQPGLRVPGAFDGFELAVRGVVGQQVSVRAATTLCGRLAARFGAALATGLPGLDRAFPDAAALASAPVAAIAAAGMPQSRARTIVELARAVASGRVDLARGGAADATVAALLAVPGIGPWTAQYVALRGLSWPDAFPAGDLGIRRALGVTTARAAEQRAGAWRPWRAYAAMHLWSSLA